MSESTNIMIVGAKGRMGQRLIALASDEPGVRVAGSVDRNDAVRVVDGTQVVVDFSAPAATRAWLAACVACRAAMVIGTTGLTETDHKAIDDAARTIPVVQSPNMSPAVNVLFKLAGQVAKTLGAPYDIEITEAHHRFKQDAPSGTAIGMAESIKSQTGRNVPTHSLRLGDEVGKHTIYFAALGERLELTHVATSRDTFVRGALRAAQWVAAQKPGRYTMMDVLGLS